MTWFVNSASKKTKKKTTGNDSSSNFDTEGRSIYYYTGVDDDSVFDLNKELERKSKDLTILGVTNDIDPPPIRLKIHSYGGSVFAGFAAMNYITSSKVPVHTYVDGAAASAATLISVVGKYRYINEHAFMLIHQLSSWSCGTYEQLKDDMMNNDMLMKKIYKIYEQHARIPKTDLKKLLTRDIWWDAKKCLEYGLVDEIV